MDSAVVVAVLGLLVAPVAAVVSWVLSSGRRSSESTSALVVASGEAVDAINAVLAAVRAENAELKATVAAYKVQVERLTAEVDELKRTIDSLNERWYINVESGTVGVEKRKKP